MNLEILKKTYELAKERYYESLQKPSSNDSSIFSLDELRNYHEEMKNNELFKYLNSLSFNDNLMIIAVMYIGRDYTEEEFAEEEKLFDKKVKDMKDTFATKELVIKQIYQKVPLHEYLENAFKLYNIEI